MQATQWIAQITRTVIDNGSARVEDSQWTWNLSTHVEVQFRMPKKYTGIGAGVPVWEAVETQEYTGSGHENLSQIYDSGGSVIAEGQPASRKPSPNFLLSMDFDAGTYILSFGTLNVPWDGTINYSGAFSIPQPDVPFWGGENSGEIRRPLPESGMLLQGQDSYPLNKPPITHASLGVTPVYTLNLSSGQIQVTWNIQPKIETLELAVEIDGYQDWLPEGNFKDATKPGKVMNVTAKVQGTNGAPTTAKATWIRFELLEISKEPGVCLNQPLRANANTEADYSFEMDKNQIPLFLHSAAKVETLPGEYASQKAVISSFDFGGWCKLKVTAMVNGKVLTGYLTTDTARSSPEILIPRRQKESHIADAWLEKESATGLADSSDSEDVPAGDGHNGDGFSLYEEYRGFAENGKILRTKAKKKDLMVLNLVGGPGAAACQLFKKMSELEVHHRFQEVEFSSAANEDNWLNFNNSTHHETDQHGLRIVLDPNAKGVAKAHNRNAASFLHSTPGSKSKITVPGDLQADALADRSGRGFNSLYAAATYAHEIGHGCAIYHHGDTDPALVSWTARDGAEALDWFENGATIFPLIEDGRPLGTPALVTDDAGNQVYRTINLYVADQRGEHSGNTQCAMRYDVASAYIFPTGTAQRFLKGDREVFGTSLCLDGKGTGVNAAERLPRPRFGDATEGRGKCKSQLCVNDKYVSDTKHTR